jgi:hypothetical protein
MNAPRTIVPADTVLAEIAELRQGIERLSRLPQRARSRSCYGPPDRSVAQGDLCHEAPARPVTRPSRSSATRSIDKFLGGFFLHW